MSADQDHVQSILLRILGVLFIIVGVALVTQQVRSDATNPLRLAQSVISDVTEGAAKCNRADAWVKDHGVRVYVRTGERAPRVEVQHAPFAPLSPLPPMPPMPPMPRIISF
jgi:hypothetical protein